jgi:hypothetical protein
MSDGGGMYLSVTHLAASCGVGHTSSQAKKSSWP